MLSKRIASSAVLIGMCCLGLFVKPLFDLIILALTGLGL